MQWPSGTIAKEHWMAGWNIGLPTCCHIHDSRPDIELSIRPTGWNVTALAPRSKTVSAQLCTLWYILDIAAMLNTLLFCSSVFVCSVAQCYIVFLLCCIVCVCCLVCACSAWWGLNETSGWYLNSQTKLEKAKSNWLGNIKVENHKRITNKIFKDKDNSNARLLAFVLSVAQSEKNMSWWVGHIICSEQWLQIFFLGHVCDHFAEYLDS